MAKHLPADREHFQVERIILFTDAVFAIAITLLIIEIKVPHFEVRGMPVRGIPGEQQLLDATLDQIPEWIGFVISFLVIGSYWRAHHRQFNHVVRYDGVLLSRNMLFLMAIVIMPYTSAFFSNYFLSDLPFLLYCLNVIAAGLLQMWLWQHINDPRAKLSDSITAVERQYGYLRASIPVIVFSISALLIPVGGWLPRVLFGLIFVGTRFVNGYFRRKHQFVSH
jgi:uncharacterized membrane protein